MKRVQDYLLKYSTWLIFVFAYLFLAYKLIAFSDYDALIQHFSSASLRDYLFLPVVLVLLPFNLLFEALKWQKLVSGLQPLSLRLAFKSVLVGQTGAFFTPNRLGEFPARALILEKNNIIPATALGVVGSVMQMLVITGIGLVTAFLYASSCVASCSFAFTPYSWIVVVLFIVLVIMTSVWLIKNSTWFYERLKQSKRQVISRLGQGLSHLSRRDVGVVFIYSFLRYIVYSSQFYAMLIFMNVTLTPWQAFLSIPTIYLLVTYTPSFAFSEAMIRGSYAIFILSTFSTNEVGMALAGILVWCINYCIPIFMGSLFVKKAL